MMLKGKIYPVFYPMAIGAPSPRVKRPEHEVDHSSPFSVGDKNEWSYFSVPPYIYTSWCSTKGRTALALADNNNIHTEASSLQPHLSVDLKASKPWTSLGYFPGGGGKALAYKFPFT